MIWLRRALALAIVLAIWQTVVWLQVTPERYLPSHRHARSTHCSGC